MLYQRFWCGVVIKEVLECSLIKSAFIKGTTVRLHSLPPCIRSSPPRAEDTRDLHLSSSSKFRFSNTRRGKKNSWLCMLTCLKVLTATAALTLKVFLKLWNNIRKINALYFSGPTLTPSSPSKKQAIALLNGTEWPLPRCQLLTWTSSPCNVPHPLVPEGLRVVSCYLFSCF